MGALLDDFKGVPVARMGGQVDYQGAVRVINGGATQAQNMRFLLDTAGTRFGTQVTMLNGETGDDVTGVYCLTVLGQLNPGEVPVAFDSAGNLWQESPAGSGTLIPLPAPVPLPTMSYMGSTKGQNNLYACFRQGNTGKGLALLYNGPGQTLSPISQNPVGGVWTPNRQYLVGDVVRTSQNPSRWFRCIIPGQAGPTEPNWPVLDGYLLLSGANPTTTIVSAIGTTPTQFNPPGVLATVTSTVGFVVGATVTVSGNSHGAFNGTFTILSIGTNNITWSQAGVVGQSGSGGTIVQSTGTGVAANPAQAIDPNGGIPITSALGLAPTQFNPPTVRAIVGSTVGIFVGGQVTISGNSYGPFNGTFTVYAIGTGTITWSQSGVAGQVGTGGTILKAGNGISQWVEWTPGAQQFVPQPEAPSQIISVKGQAGAPAGTITAGKDVYVCFAYQNANGESQWTAPILFSNTAATDVLEVFFQKQNEVPGPTVAVAYNAAGYGGPRMPNWLISVLGLPDPSIAWPNQNALNVYVAAVAHSAAAPTSYFQYLSGAPVYQPVVITSIPASGTQFNPRLTGTAAFSKLPYIGEGGARYFAVERLDVNGSLVPIDPGSPLLCSFVSSIAASGTANITFIQRSGNVVTCTVDQLAGFAQDAQVIIAGVTDTTFDGSFTLTGVSPNQFGGATLIWAQTATDAASTGGTATSASAASAFVTPQDLIATIARATNVVTAVVNSLSGIAIGVSVNVAGVADTSFNGGPFVVTAVVPNLGGGGSVSWAQTAANGTSTGGSITPTGGGVGTNPSLNISGIARENNVASAAFFGQSAGLTPLPGFVVGATVTIANVTDASFDGTFTITAAAPVSLYFDGIKTGWYISWAQTAGNVAIAALQGTATLVSGGGPQQGQGNLTAIARAANVVTATLDTVANFVVGAQVQVNGVTDATYDGVFFITSINTGTNQLTWTQHGPNSSSSSGNVVQTSGGIQQPSPVMVLPPGGQFIAQDIAAFTVQGAQQAGPFNYIPQQDPITPFSATIQSIGAVNGTVMALLSTTAGLQSGSTVQISGTPNGWFDGVFILAEVNGNTVEWAGVGPGTGFAGGTLTLIPTQPTDALGQNNPLAITSIARTAVGIVSAQLVDVSDINAGQRIQVTGVTNGTFNGNFVILSVQQFPNVLSGVVTWQSATLSAASSSGGSLVGLPGILVNFDDSELAADAEVTAQLQSFPAPPTPSDLQFIEQFDMMAYIDNVNNPSAIVFGNPGDPANVAGSSGDPNNPGNNILSVNSNSGSQTVCVREIKDGPVICLKTDGGYQISISAVFPSQWTPTERWDKFGPPCPALVAVGPDFLAFVHETGVYAYVLGSSALVWVTECISGSGSWSRVNWPAMAGAGWCAIDDETRELHVGLCLDGSATVNFKLTVSYFGGWEQPEVLNRYGKLLTPRNCIKISLDPFVATTAAVLKRTITGTPIAIPNGDFETSAAIPPANWTNGFIATQGTIISPAALSYDTITPYSGIRSLIVTSDGTADEGVAMLAPFPVLPGSGYTVSGAAKVVSGAVTASIQLSFLDAAGNYISSAFAAAGYTGSVWTIITASAVAPANAATGVILAYISTHAVGVAEFDVIALSVSSSFDSRIAGRQMVYGLPGSILLPSGALQSIITAARTAGTVILTLPLGGSLTGGSVVVAGVDDQTFNGTFPSAVFSTDGTNDFCTYAQALPDSNSGSGTVALSVSALRVVMTVPDQYDDYGNGIDCRYRPWLWQVPPRMLKVGGYRASLRGNGRAYITPFTDDPAAVFQPQTVDLPASGKSVQFERGLRIPDNEYQSIEISNGAVPGAFFDLDHLELCIGEMGTRRG